MTDYKVISDLLVTKGHVRGKPVAITLFFEEIPLGYERKKVDPCGIIRFAMDLGERVCFDGKHFDCLSGAYTVGIHAGTEELRTGAYLHKNTGFYTPLAAARIKSGNYVLPQGLVRGIGAAPLDDVPDGVKVDWVVVVCNPFNANNIASARMIKDGIAPRGACGTSLCSEIFSFPFHEDNVIITPGDMGGRMANKIKPEELFVVIPNRYLENLVGLLGQIPNVEGLLDATKPEDSEYWVKKQARSSKVPPPAAGPDETPTKTAPPPAAPVDDEPLPSPEFRMPWDDEARALLLSAPPEVQAFAVGNVETFAAEKRYRRITRQVIVEQMESVGLTLEMLTGMAEE